MAESAIDRYNRLLGKPTRRPIRSARQQGRVRSNIAQGRSTRVARAKRNPKSTYSSGSSRGGGSRRGGSIRGGSYSPEEINSAWNATVDRLIENYTQSAAEQEAINRVNQDREEAADEDRPWYQDIARAVGISNPFDENSGWQDSIIGRSLDILSRPAYGLAEGLQSLGEQETHRGYSPGDIGYSLGNFFTGFGRGFSGEDKTGFGQIYEAVKENEASDIGSGLRAFEEAHPLLEQRMAQALGFGGELFLDPLNRFTPTRSRVITETGENATASAIRAAVLRAADDVTRDLQTANPSWSANPQAVLNRVETAVANSLDNTLLEINHGGRRQRRLHPRQFAETAASNAALELRSAVTSPVIELVRRFRNPVGRNIRQNFTLRKFENALRNNPDFEEFYLKFIADPDIQRLLPANPTPAQVYRIVQNPSVQRLTSVWNRVLDDVLSKFDGEVEDFRQRLSGDFNNVSYPTVGVRFYGREKPIKFVGRAYKYAGSKLDGHGPFGSDLFERMSINRILPDRVSLFSTRARSGNITGMPSLQQFNDELRVYGRNFTEKEMHQITKYLDEGIASVGDPKIDAALTFIRDKYREMFDREVYHGVRDPLELADNYHFLYNKGGSAVERKAFKDGRKAAFRDKNKVGAADFDLQNARSRGLRPTEHALENLYRRFEKSQRDITRQLFLRDLLENYATMTKPLPSGMASKFNLVRVPNSQLPEAMRLAAEAADEVVYLPRHMYSGKQLGTKGINGFFEDFAEMLSWSPQESGRFARNFAKIINSIKYLQTVPNPGFHLRNMMGDIAMGLMDDINPADYARIIKKYATKGDFEIVPGVTFTWQEMVDMFHRNADAGFFQVDTGTYNSLTAGRIPKDISRKMVNKLRRASDIREEMGRFVHFATAYQQEAKALWKKGTRNLDRIKTQAEDAALWRVNAYKFDYGALTPFEQKIKTLAFPFYTYQRKAIPLLLEQMYSNPQFMTMASRFMQYNDGSGADAFNAMNIPQYIRDMGFAILNDAEEPTYVGADALNLGALNLLASTSPGDFFRTALSNLNPLAAAPIELGTNTDLYMNKPLNQDWREYILNQLPMAGDIQSERGFDIPLIPGRVGTENPLTARLFGIGLPYRNISTRQQEQQHEANLDEAIDSPMKQFNYSQDLYQITEDMDNEQLVYTLRNKLTGDVIAMARTPQDLIELARQQPNANYEEPYVSSLRPPTYQDIMTRMGQ